MQTREHALCIVQAKIVSHSRLFNPFLSLQGHDQSVNAIAWAPHSHCHICSAGDDSQALSLSLSRIHTYTHSLSHTHTRTHTHARLAGSPYPSTRNPQPSTLNPQPSTLNPQPSTLKQALIWDLQALPRPIEGTLLLLLYSRYRS